MNDTLLTCANCRCQYLISPVLLVPGQKVRCNECGNVWILTGSEKDSPTSNFSRNQENFEENFSKNGPEMHTESPTNPSMTPDIEQTLANIKKSLKKDIKTPFTGSLKNYCENSVPANSQKEQKTLDISQLIIETSPTKTGSEPIFNYFEKVKQNGEEKEEIKSQKTGFFAKNSEMVSKKIATQNFGKNNQKNEQKSTFLSKISSILMVIFSIGNVLFWTLYFLQFTKYWKSIEKFYSTILK